MKPCTCEDTFYKPVVKDPIKVESLPWHADGRGKLLECLRADSIHFSAALEFGQAYITTINPGVTKAWHFHEQQTDRMVLLRGTVRFGCVNSGKEISDECTNYNNVVVDTVLDLVVSDYDPKLIIIPAFIYHGFKNIGDCEAYVLNIPNNIYNYENPDEKRAAFNCFTPVFDWRAKMDG